MIDELSAKLIHALSNNKSKSQRLPNSPKLQRRAGKRVSRSDECLKTFNRNPVMSFIIKRTQNQNQTPDCHNEKRLNIIAQLQNNNVSQAEHLRAVSSQI